MKSFLSLLFVSSILLASCKKELEPQQSTAPTNVVPFTEVGKQMQNQSAISSQVQQDPNMVNQNKALATPAPVAKGMNPAHGQPGHRCDIPVGAPLNSPIATAKNTPVIQPVSTNPVTSAPTVTTPTPEGMNPPHGQTNHRCDIAVGAPLPKS
ncbi:hypothetical protein [Flavobacterium gawalongense]|uniref:Lipoprotein n=1 Tax=Flavobacterium gawalongense TaxID=2594432 RepID=A0ABY3CUW6_9FLAO|nr:hypothetical protein [Flavobacterium gawalongense]TRX03652.1 hypothetical protein FNW33_03000 [Flavobacterium gawalongense]TRX08799.1 hypothetical protein FNW12_03140 [Flavobacterium gawalongense]